MVHLWKRRRRKGSEQERAWETASICQAPTARQAQGPDGTGASSQGPVLPFLAGRCALCQSFRADPSQPSCSSLRMSGATTAALVDHPLPLDT